MADVIRVGNIAELNRVINDNEVVVIDFTAPSWCIPCRQFAPHFEEAAARSEHTFVMADLDDDTAFTDEYDIQSVPTVKLFRNGAYVDDIKARTVVPLLAELPFKSGF